MSSREGMTMVNSSVLAHAVATVVGVGYVLCRLIAAVAPQVLFSVGQSWFHTVNLEPLRTTGWPGDKRRRVLDCRVRHRRTV